MAFKKFRKMKVYEASGYNYKSGLQQENKKQHGRISIKEKLAEKKKEILKQDNTNLSSMKITEKRKFQKEI